jgi:cytochrome c biogenesis protein CcmG, thiol:disulfide interchange protein DsbE
MFAGSDTSIYPTHLCDVNFCKFKARLRNVYPVGNEETMTIYLNRELLHLTSFVALLFVGGVTLAAQSRVDLLRRVEDHYEKSDTFDVKGVATATIPKTSWRISYEFETQGSQPTLLPANIRGTSMQTITETGHGLRAVRTDPNANDPEPQQGFETSIFGNYNEIARHLMSAKKMGSEVVYLEGRSYSCEIIDAKYDTSPGFKPHSSSKQKRLIVDPSRLLVLAEAERSGDGIKWEANVTSMSFNAAPSQALIQTLEQRVSIGNERSAWIGHALPNLTLSELSGGTVTLPNLLGKPILLDFWGSYCNPCKSVTLHSQDLLKRYRPSGLVVLTITQDSASNARRWTSYNHVDLPVLLDPEGIAFKAFGIQGVPTTILIGKDGKIIHYVVGIDPTLVDSALEAKFASELH